MAHVTEAQREDLASRADAQQAGIETALAANDTVAEAFHRGEMAAINAEARALNAVEQQVIEGWAGTPAARRRN